MELPSTKQLDQNGFTLHKYNKQKHIGNLSSLLCRENNSIQVVIFFIIIAFGIVIVFQFIKLYTHKFFFSDITYAFRLGYMKDLPKNRHYNDKVFLPPYNDLDLINIIEEKIESILVNEKPSNASVKETIFAHVKDSDLPYEARIDFIIKSDINANEYSYKRIWESLDLDEKFVMYDFAEDHFVNYSNKNILMKLIAKGLIVLDPLNGRLRVLNYGFNRFVLKYALKDVEFKLRLTENRDKGNFIKWRLPIAIIALALLAFLIYNYRSSFDSIILISGSILSVLGLILKFFDAYKKVQ